MKKRHTPVSVGSAATEALVQRQTLLAQRRFGKGYPAELDFCVAHIRNQKKYVVSCHILFLLFYSITFMRVYPWYTLWLLDT
jgi:hypothetical protein